MKDEANPRPVWHSVTAEEAERLLDTSPGGLSDK